MAVFDNSYSRFVAWMKILLPLAALALLSTLFLFSRNSDPTANIPYSQVEVESIAREQRLTSPRFSGVTKDGASIEVSADIARPDTTNPQRMNGEDLQARIDLPGGSNVLIEAPVGAVDGRENQITVSDGVLITTSNGYRVTSDEVIASIEATSVVSPGPIHADGPLGTLDAGQMNLVLTEGRYQLVFKERVKLIYDPTKGE